MSFDLDLTLKEMAAAARAAFGRASKKTGAGLRRVLDDQKDALRRMAAARLAGEIDDAELQRQLANTRLVFEAGLSMVRAVSKASIQKALDAAFDVLVRAIGRAVAGA